MLGSGFMLGTAKLGQKLGLGFLEFRVDALDLGV